MVSGYARVQLFHAEGNRFTEQRMHLLGVQAERSELLDVGGQTSTLTTRQSHCRSPIRTRSTPNSAAPSELPAKM